MTRKENSWVASEVKLPFPTGKPTFESCTSAHKELCTLHFAPPYDPAAELDAGDAAPKAALEAERAAAAAAAKEKSSGFPGSFPSTVEPCGTRSHWLLGAELDPLEGPTARSLKRRHRDRIP